MKRVYLKITVDRYGEHRIWYLNGLTLRDQHRDIGPAIVYEDGYREWVKDGHSYKIIDPKNPS